MIKSTLYLDTSVINFLFADDAPEKKEITIDFFENFVKLGIYDTYITEYVIAEINQTPDNEERQRLIKIIEDYPIEILPIDKIDEIGILAQDYLDNGIMPPKKLFDALHVAFCVVSKIDYLVSWNFKHLANVNRERRILAKNYELGYIHPLRIITPTELTGYGN
jgi:predicted nucleic acid-binding protein